MSNISIERLEDLAKGQCFLAEGAYAEAQEMARELLKYRKARKDAVELSVWYGAMPETNGKTNWTAMLHRKGQHPWGGITIDRSEYPDRTLYEADRMRYLIGEISDKPDCLSYDADKHSGYTAPQLQPVSEPYKLPRKATWEDAPQGVENVDWAQGWNTCREAMINMMHKVS